MSEVLKNLGDSLDGEKSQLALIDLSENKDLYTYGELDSLITAQAEVLEINRSDRIGLLGMNSAAFVSTFFAIMRRGGVAVPINTKFQKDTLARISEDAELKFAFVDPLQANQLPSNLDQRKMVLRDSTSVSYTHLTLPTSDLV